MTLDHNFTKMEISDKFLSVLNIRDGSVVKVKAFAEPLDHPVSVTNLLSNCQIQIPQRAASS